jgi:monoamine oxidase
MRKELAKPLSNKLFFAGEASNEVYSSTVHGAYLSGLRAAKEMAAI